MEVRREGVQYADQMLQVLVDIALNGESETARILAADKVIDRAMGKTPQHIDVSHGKEGAAAHG